LIAKGVSSYLVRIIHSYLSDRFGYVQLGNTRSRVLDIKAGCIQGSVLGPILFNILVSDLDEKIRPNKIVSYADDAYVVVSANNHSELESSFKSVLNKHLEWLKENGMVCNVMKTELMVLGDQKIRIEIDGNEITSQDRLKVLGVTLDPLLNWDAHVDKVVGKCRSFLFGLRYLRKHLEISVISKILKAQIVSSLTYASPAWSYRISYRSKIRLRSIYFHIIRVMLRDFKFELNRRSMLRLSSMEDLDIILEKRLSCFAFKVLTILEPNNLAGIFISKSYSNERTPDRLTFFDTSQNKFGKAGLSNNLKKVVETWKFDWMIMSVEVFKTNLAAQLSNIHRLTNR